MVHVQLYHRESVFAMTCQDTYKTELTVDDDFVRGCHVRGCLYPHKDVYFITDIRFILQNLMFFVFCGDKLF